MDDIRDLFEYVDVPPTSIEKGLNELHLCSGFRCVLRGIKEDAHLQAAAWLLKGHGADSVALEIVLHVLELIPDAEPDCSHQHDLHFAGYLWVLSHHPIAWQAVCGLMLLVNKTFWARQMAEWLIDQRADPLYNEGEVSDD